MVYIDKALAAAIADLVKDVKGLSSTVNNLTDRFDKWSDDLNKLKESKTKKRLSNKSKNKNKDYIYNNIYNGVYGKDIKSVMEYYRTYHPKALKGLSEKSKSFLGVRGRLEDGFTVGELTEAIDGMHKSPFHLGQNAQRTKYLSLELCMRSSENINRFIEISRDPTPDVGVNTIKTVESARSWLDGEEVTDEQDF
jgi:hypothetical protein